MSAIIDCPERVRTPLDFLNTLVDTEECRQYCEAGPSPGYLAKRVMHPNWSFDEDYYVDGRVGLTAKLEGWRREWSTRVGDGWQQLGSGAYSVALAPLGVQDRVLVVSLDRDPAKESWMSWCTNNQDNPFVPRIYLTGEDKCGRWYWMERLSSSKTGLSSETLNLLHELIDMPYCSGIPGQARKHPKLVECLSFCLDTEFTLDLHSGNIMMRGDQVVILDPIC